MRSDPPAEPTLDAMLVVAAGVAAGPALALDPLAASVALGGAASLLAGRAPRWLLALALVAAALSGARAAGVLAEAAAIYRRAGLALPAPATCEATAVVLSRPVTLRGGGRSARAPGPDRIDVELYDAVCDGRPLGPPLAARLYGAPPGLVRGDVVRLGAQIGVQALFANPGLPDTRARVALQGVAVSGGVLRLEVRERGGGLSRLVDGARAHVRERIEATFSRDAAPYARALVLGETDLEDSDSDAFRRSGLAHLLAVSGMHLVLVVVAFVGLLRMVLVRIEALAAAGDVGRIAAGVGVPLCWLYADFAGGGGSAFRAAGMLSIGLFARAIGLRTPTIRCFALSLLGGAVLEPLALLDLSFALSVAATTGLLAARGLARRLEEGAGPVRRWVGGSLLATLAAMLGCAPLLATLGPELPLLGLAANVLAGPLGEAVALPICLAHALLGWWPDAEQGAAFVAGGALSMVRALAHAAADMAGASVPVPSPTPEQLAGLSLLVVGWVVGSARERGRVLAWGVAVLAGLEVVAGMHGAPRGELRVTFLDVAQGDAVLVDFPDGRAMLIDGGGIPHSPVDIGERVLLPVLRARRRRRLDVVVVSHPHADHYGGLVTAVPRLEVGEIWDNGQAEDASHPIRPVRDMLAAARERGARVRGPAELCGQVHRFGEATVEVLGPCPSYDSALGLNDNSLVLRVSYGAHAVLLMGDAEHEQEELLVTQLGDRLRADVLKVGHHGSKTSSHDALLAASRPVDAVISCGPRNRLGHPHPTTMARLAAHGVTVHRTDRRGAIVWRTDGERANWDAARW